ncbi:MAG: hypothetical protein U0X76_04770 [Bacteroidia bacterium]
MVCIYTITRHAMKRMDTKKAAHWVMTPFYNDHTAYVAALALYPSGDLPLSRSYEYIQGAYIFGSAFILLLLALILS